jgi:nitronate monooxygenase
MQQHETLLPDFPVQNTLTQEIRNTSAAENNQEFMSLWSGQSPRLARIQTVKLLMKDIIADAKKLSSKDAW